MRVIGTAGHVDHGKSTLVTALTGMNPDRLKEEQEREMTIDLGFAWLTLPSGETVSLVDVPGHEAFIKNMLAGVGGVDAALLVIAADEGIMPQTREHLAILDLLQVQGGVVALTKTDLATEPGWLDLVESEIRETLTGTPLAEAPIVRVSARTGQGLGELTGALVRALDRVTEKRDRGRPRLPVDRVFTIAGFGTVVTGTLSDGRLEVGDEVEVAPRGLRARIRGIQAHKEKLVRASPGGRTALNLAGVAKEELARGDTIILPGSYQPTQLIDARIRWLASAPRSLRHNQALDLFIFASEVPVRVRLLGTNELAPGESGWAQLLLGAPVVAAARDRFVLRYASPSLTVGGGVVVEPHPGARHRRNNAQVIARLERLEQGSPAELLINLVDTRGPVERDEVRRALALDQGALDSALNELKSSGQLTELAQGESRFLVTAAGWERLAQRIVGALEEYHRQFPLRAGMPREELKSRLGLEQRAFDAALEHAAAGQIIRSGERAVWLPPHRVHFGGDLGRQVNLLLTQFERAPYQSPSLAEAESAIGGEALGALIEQGRLIKISDQVLLTPEAERAMMQWVVQAIRERGEVTAAELRDQFQTSRKYAIAFLEYLDQKRVTRRRGDARVLR